MDGEERALVAGRAFLAEFLWKSRAKPAHKKTRLEDAAAAGASDSNKKQKTTYPPGGVVHAVRAASVREP